MTTDPQPDPLLVANADAWRAWLDANEAVSDGVWLLLAKKGEATPTSLTYAEALEEALCSGWIDGQRRTNDAATFRQRFTPRRPRSIWSQRNVEHVARLAAAGRMRPRGLREVDLARADGRWDRAYAGSATAEVPEDLTAALAAHPGARERFDSLSGRDRFQVLLQLMTAPNETTRSRRLTAVLRQLASRPAAGM